MIQVWQSAFLLRCHAVSNRDGIFSGANIARKRWSDDNGVFPNLPIEVMDLTAFSWSPRAVQRSQPSNIFQRIFARRGCAAAFYTVQVQGLVKGLTCACGCL